MSSFKIFCVYNGVLDKFIQKLSFEDYLRQVVILMDSLLKRVKLLELLNGEKVTICGKWVGGLEVAVSIEVIVK